MKGDGSRVERFDVQSGIMGRALCAVVVVFAMAVACGGSSGRSDGVVVGEFEMRGVSMDPTLRDGDKVKASSYEGVTPKRGEVIVFRATTHPDRSFIKRVIGVPGDTIEISEATGDVSVNGALLEELYVSGPTECIVKCVWTLPEANNDEARQRCGSEACYFVMGDNREDPGDSADSRKGFLVTTESIVGRVEVND